MVKKSYQICTAVQVNSWRTLQASHRLEGPIYLRRNFSPVFLTLESWLANQMRHACSLLMVAELAGGCIRPYISTAAQDRLTESDKMSLAEMMAKDVRAPNSTDLAGEWAGFASAFITPGNQYSS